MESAAGHRGRLALSIAGIRMILRGLDDRLLRLLSERFALFVEREAVTGGADLDCAVGRSAVKQHLPYPEPGGPLDYRLETEVAGGRLRAWSYSFSGEFDLDGAGGRLELCDSGFEPASRSVENFLRVALAWKAAARGGFLLHASGLVREGRAFLFFGPSGSGKTTVTRFSPDDLLLNDDCILVSRDPAGFRASGVPFRGVEEGAARDAGRFPVAGLFRLVQAAEVSTERLTPARAAGEIAASVPFVTERPEGFERVLPAIEALVRQVPVFRLGFRLSGDFWPEVERAARGGE